MEKSSDKRGKRVFLSYAFKDREFAQGIAKRLKAPGVDVWYDEWEMAIGDSIVNKIESAISSSDYIIILLSPNSVKSKWVQHELSAALVHELTARDVTIMPVVIADCEIPIALKSMLWLDLRKDPERNIGLLIGQIATAPRIDFSHINKQTFENLIGDLLKMLGFINIQYEVQIGKWLVDIKAEYVQRDPFGVETSEMWLVETKFYKNERADLQSLHQLTVYLQGFPERYKGLLVTNGQLTSAAKQWLQTTQEETRMQIRVIEGPELKKLLLCYPGLVRKYFPTTKEDGDL